MLGLTKTGEDRSNLSFDRIMAFNLLSQQMGMGKDEDAIQHNVKSVKTLPAGELSKLETLLGFLKNPALKLKLNQSNFQPFLDCVGQAFDTEFENFAKKVNSFSTKKRSIQVYRKKQSYMQNSPLSVLLKDIISVLNRIDFDLVQAGLLELHIEQMHKHFEMADGWIQDFEDEDLINNDIHRLLLTFSLKVNSLIAESHIKCGLRLQQEGKFEEAGTELLTAQELGYLCLQSIEELESTYEYDSRESKLIAHTLPIWGHAFYHQFKLAQNHVDQLLGCLKKENFIISNLMEPILFYAHYSIISDRGNIQHALQSLQKVQKFLDKKKVFSEGGGTSSVEMFAIQLKDCFQRAIAKYDIELSKRLSHYQSQVHYADNQITIKTKSSGKANKLASHLGKNPLFKYKRNKDVIVITNVFSIPTNLLFKTLDRVLKEPTQNSKKVNTNKSSGKIKAKNKKSASIAPLKDKAENELPALEAALSELTLENTKDEVSGSDSETDTDLVPLADPLDSTKDITQEKAINPSLTASLVFSQAADVRDNAASSSLAAIPPSSTQDELEISLKSDRKGTSTGTYGFKKPIFEDSCFQKLEGAIGIFVAYNPERDLRKKSKKKSIPQKVESRFHKLLNFPLKVGPKNQNGFKWIAQGNSATLVGKIARQPYRLFPIEKEINENGETAYFYGTLKNTKRGKRSNQYGN